MEHLQEQNHCLKSAFKFWRTATLSVTCISLAVTTAMAGRIAGLNAAAVDADKAYQERIKTETRLRDRAVREMADMSIRLADLEREKAIYTTSIEDNTIPLADKSESEYQYMGEFTITAYCPCEKCCGKWSDGVTESGVPAEEGVIAVDPDIIPLGSKVKIDGQEYLAADTGGAIKGAHIDVYYNSHDAALEFGRQTSEVWVAEP